MPGKYGKLECLEDDGYKLTQKNNTVYYFSPEGNLTAIEDLNGNRTALTYDENGKMVKIQNECGYFEFAYEDNLIAKITDNAGRSVEYAYTDGKLTGVKNVEGNLYTYEYDNNNRLIRLIDPLNNVTITNVYDEKGRTTEQTMADGVTNELAYDDTNLTTTLMQGNGSQIVFKYDEDYRIYERVYINGSEQLTFNEHNQITSFTDKNGNTYYV
jgi:YD repeat-containing protein